jgi:hypothetical protein
MGTRNCLPLLDMRGDPFPPFRREVVNREVSTLLPCLQKARDFNNDADIHEFGEVGRSLVSFAVLHPVAIGTEPVLPGTGPRQAESLTYLGSSARAMLSQALCNLHSTEAELLR